MNRRIPVPVVLAVSVSIAFAAPVEGQRVDRRTKPTPPPAKTEAPPPQTGLSARALVPYPTSIPGAEGWTIESRRHRSSMACLSLSPDGKRLVTGGIDGTIRVWNAETGEFVRALVGHDSYVYGLAWSPDGKVVASAGSFDGTVRLWDVQEGKSLSVFRGLQGYVYHVAWSPDGNTLIAAGGGSGWIWIWKVASKGTEMREGSLLAEFGQHLYRLAWSPDSTQVAVCGRQMPVSILDVATKKSTRTMGLTNETWTTAAWSPDGRFLAGAGAGGTTVWDLKEQEEKATVKLPGACGSVAWSPDGKQLVTASTAGVPVQIWDAASGKPVSQVAGSGTTVYWHPKTRQIFTMSSVHFAVFDPAAGKQLRSVDAAGLTPPVWTAGRPVVGGLGTTKLSLWDANTTKFISRLEGHTAAVSAVSWARDGNTLASASYDNTVRLWEARAGKALETLKGHTAAVTTVAWAPDGKTLASAGADNTVMLWNAKGQNRAKLEGHTAPVTALAWSRSSHLLASGGSDQTIIVWDTDKKRQVRMISALQPVQSLAWTTVGRTSALACGTSDDTVRIYNTTTGQEIGNLPSAASPPNVAALAWLPGAGMLLSGRSCHLVQLWDVGAGKPVQSLQAMAPVQYVTWGANGAMLVSGNSERTVRFWDAATGMPRGVLLEEKDAMAMISADGNWRWDPERKPDLVFVVQVSDTQLTMTPDEFSKRFGGKSRSTRGKSG